MSPREWWTQKSQEMNACKCHHTFIIASAQELNPAQASQDRLARAHECTQEGMRAGMKAGGSAFVASAIPTLWIARNIPWAKRNINHTGQALIISSAMVAAYFIVADQTILACARASSGVKKGDGDAGRV